MPDLSQLRAEIDQIDAQLLTLIRQRAQKSQEIGDYKRTSGQQIQDPSRESEILAKCQTPGEEKIYKSILENSRNLQR